MEGRYTEIELEWIAEALTAHGAHLKKILQQAIQDKDLINTGALESSIESNTTKYGPNPVLQISFMSYGRAIEIAKNKSKNTKVLAGKRLFSAIAGTESENTKRKKRKNTRWYARNVYGSLNRLIGIISFEFGDQERERIKGILESRIKLQ